MKINVVSLLLGVALCAVPVSSLNAQAKTYDVREFGAKGDGKTLDTAALQAALDACAKAGGGTVRLSAGTYLSRPITLGNKTTLLLEEGATLKATDEPKDYLPDDVTWDEVLKGTKRGPFTPFIGGKELTDSAIVGKGTIDGSGEKWWIPAEEARRKVSGYTLPRPNLIVLNRCKNLRLSGIRLINSPKFHFVPTDCEDVLVEDVTILAPERAANTDGIDPSNCRNVTITRCTIDTGDDNIAIKSGKKVEGREFACENILVTDCVFLHGHGVSIGAEVVGGVRGLVVKNCRFEGTENGIRIKSRRDRGGVVQDITYSNLTMTNVYPAISIAGYYQSSSQTLFPKDDKGEPVTGTTPIFRNIKISNLTATSTKNAGLIVGLPESLITNVVLENVRISAETGLTIAHAKGIQLKDVNVEVKQGEPFLLHNAQVDGLPKAADTH
jgi:polygalacturonase